VYIRLCQVKELTAREEARPRELAEAVAAAKEKVYAKVSLGTPRTSQSFVMRLTNRTVAFLPLQAKVQFEAGNKEFQKVKGLLKDAKAERDAALAAVEALQGQLAAANAATEAERARGQDKGRRATELRGMLFRLVDSVHAATAQARGEAAPAPSSVKEDETSLAAEQAAATKADGAAAALAQELLEVGRCKQSLQAAAGVLEGSLQRLEAQLATEKAATQTERDRAAVAEALLATSRVELADAVKECDHQMNALAKVPTSLPPHC